MYHFYTFYSWYCHLDDDMYVNTEQLGKILLSRDHNEEHYLGRNYYTNQFTVPQHTLRHYPSGLIVSLINCIVLLLSNYNDIMMLQSHLGQISKPAAICQPVILLNYWI